MVSAPASASMPTILLATTERAMMTLPPLRLACAALILAAALPAAAQPTTPIVVLNEGFNDINTLPSWSFVNQSTPQGQSWFQGNTSIFRSQAGPASSYIASNFLSALGGAGAIENWLITPALRLIGPSTLSFFARSERAPGLNDTMEVLFSSGTGLGDFTVVGTVGAIETFPGSWRQFAANVDHDGIGRFAFRHIGDASASNYIGIDTVNITTIPEPSAYLMLLAGLGGLALLRRKLTQRLTH